MKNIKILTFGRLASEFEKYIKVHHPTIHIVKATSIGEVNKTIKKINVLAGFNFFEGLDLSSIQWIHSFGAGVDSFLHLPNISKETLITRTTGRLGDKIGEYCLAYILADLKFLLETYNNQQKASWKQFVGKNLYDQKALILGTGTIGSGIAKTLKKHLHIVVGLNSSGSPGNYFDKIVTWETLPEAAKDFDIVINALPQTNETRAKIDSTVFKHFKEILFINVGRGSSVNESDMLTGIDLKNIRRAILDVFSEEPLPPTSVLWKKKNILITPHQSGITSIEDIISSFDLCYRSILKGEKNHLFINRENGY